MPAIFPFNTIFKYSGELRNVTVISVCLFLTLAVCLCDAGNAVSAEKTDTDKNELSEGIQAKEGSLNSSSNRANPEKGLKSRDPMSIPDEIERQMGNVEPPEVRITGIIETDKKKAAIAELNLENFKGVVMFEPGMTVSIPKPGRDESSHRWMTLFTVRDITGHGVLIILENNEEIWVPLMGEKK
ncbi:MAG: hypothetical protein PVG39_09520 [Desulfobacteraceae bacterium]|jgi:hypothetical protein